MTGGKEKRTARNLWVRPKSQLKFLMILSGGFLILAGLIGFVMVSFSDYLALLQTTNQIDTQTVILITSHLYFYLKMAMGLAAIFSVLGLAIGIMLTHRIFGPMVPIRHQLAKMIEGDYSGRIHLRTSDEFKEVANDINTLTDRLKQAQARK